MTAQTKTLASAMAAAFAEIEAATKSATNPAFKQNGKVSKYADLGSVIEAIKQPLISHGLFVTQHCHPSDDGVIVETVLGHASGEEKSLGKLFVPANNRNAHGFGSALTYARRYALATAFVVPTEDDDGNEATKTVESSVPTEDDDGNEATKTVESSGDAKAKNGDATPGPITDDQRDIIQALAPAAGKTVQELCKAYRIESLKGLTEAQAVKLIERMKVVAQAAKEPAHV